jgi:hypothetical protein
LHHFPLEHWLPSFRVPIPVQMECPSLVLIAPQTLAFLSSHVSANLILLQKWLDRCDDSGLSFCQKVKNCVLQLLPLGCVYLHRADITRYCLTHHSDQQSMFFF